MTSTRNVVLIVAIFGVVALFVVGVPIVEVQVQEEYQESVPYDVQVPYTATEQRTQTLGSTYSDPLEAGHYTYWSPNLERGVDVSFSFSATDTVDAMILTLSHYNNFKDGESYEYERKAEEETSGTLEYYTPNSGTYYFIIHNIHSGFLGFGEKDIVINSATITATWDEEVTRYRTETEYRLETKYRTVTKKVTIIESIMGDH